MANKKIPMRKCVGCQEMKEKKSLIRVVKTAEGDIILDDTGKKNGRGAYICKSLECFKKAKKTKALERSLGVSVSEQVYEELEKEMNQIDRQSTFYAGLSSKVRQCGQRRVFYRESCKDRKGIFSDSCR